MMTAVPLALPPTYQPILRDAIKVLRLRLDGIAHERNVLEAGEVWSLLQDTCIDVGCALGITEQRPNLMLRVTSQLLPIDLQSLYVEAKARSEAPVDIDRNDQANYSVIGVIFAVNESLARITAL